MISFSSHEKTKPRTFLLMAIPGKIKEINEIKNPKAEHYIKAKNKSKEELIFIFSNLSYNFKSSVNGGNAWIGQQEILEAYYQYINN